MQINDDPGFRQRLLALRNAIDAVLGEPEENKKDIPAPRIRRNLKKQRIEAHENNFVLGTWKKPEQLRKSK